jgi:hypothetical protein
MTRTGKITIIGPCVVAFIAIIIWTIVGISGGFDSKQFQPKHPVSNQWDLLVAITDANNTNPGDFTQFEMTNILFFVQDWYCGPVQNRDADAFSAGLTGTVDHVPTRSLTTAALLYVCNTKDNQLWAKDHGLSDADFEMYAVVK